ncbi:MAG: hypothetical protein AAB361_01610 [Patescibacteria group bacterium]
MEGEPKFEEEFIEEKNETEKNIEEQDSEALDFSGRREYRDEKGAEIKNEDPKYLEVERVILQCADNTEFRKAVLPQNPEQVDAKILGKALEILLNADGLEISKLQRLELFRQTLEYYSELSDVKIPLWHSTSSFSLRNGLEEGFAGGYGKYTGETSIDYQEGRETQKGLSVSHPDYHYAEVFQQIFARASAKKSELAGYLSVDSEKITGEFLPQVFVKELFASLSKDEIREMSAKRDGVKPEEITDEQIEERRRDFIERFNKREDVNQRDKIKKEFLPNVPNKELRDELEQELDHPFPCFITFEGAGKEPHLTTFSRGEKPTHIPFEDMYWDKFTGKDIKEVRVPQNQIEKTQKWFTDKGIKNVKFVPLELYEIKRIIQDSV